MASLDHGRLRPLFQVASVFLLLAAVTVHVQFGDRLRAKLAAYVPAAAKAKADPPAQVVVVQSAAPPSAKADETPIPEPGPSEPEPPPPPLPPAPAPPSLDRAAVARAEAALDAASRDRARAEARAADAAGRLEAASNRAALDAAMAKKLAFRIRDPSAQINRIAARGGFLKAEHDKLRAELAALRTLPRPKATSILSKTPVARPTVSDEFHFELRRNRVTFINLDRLMELAKADAQVRIRMTDRSGLITSQVGPVGSFSLGYILGRASGGIDELIERQSIRFDLKGWELVPETEQRGETYEATRNPISQYARAVNQLAPGRSIITLWVYPDSFTLYRRLRAELVDRGFSVAGRPLPEGMMIRGSPMGSVSAAQ
jgi:hypothetical protein